MSIFNFEPRTESQFKIAKTNYFLAKLRELLEVDFEKYVKWGYGGAFNGAGLINKTNGLVTVYFHHKKTALNSAKYSIFKINDIWVTAESLSSIDIENVLKKANDDFDELLNRNGDVYLNQVKRFLFYIYYQKNEDLELVERFVEIIKSEFFEITTSPYPELMPLDFPIKDFDVEIVLEKAIPVSEFIEKLRKHIPKINELIFGSGIFVGYGEIPNFPFGLNLYARQF